MKSPRVRGPGSALAMPAGGGGSCRWRGGVGVVARSLEVMHICRSPASPCVVRFWFLIDTRAPVFLIDTGVSVFLLVFLEEKALPGDGFTGLHHNERAAL
jgi:hypothetical protein